MYASTAYLTGWYARPDTHVAQAVQVTGRPLFILTSECSSVLMLTGECSSVFNAGPSNADNWTALKAHYVDKFGRNDAQHTQLIRDHFEELEIYNNAVCLVCSVKFMRIADLFQHLASKSRDVDEMVAIDHRSHFEALVLPFVGKL